MISYVALRRCPVFWGFIYDRSSTTEPHLMFQSMLSSHWDRFPLQNFSVPVVHSCCCSVAWLCPTLCNPMDCSTPGFPGPSLSPEFAQTHVHWVNDAIQPSHSLLSPSPALNELSLCIKWSKYWSFSYRPYSFEFANLCIQGKWRIEHIDHLPELTWGRLGNVPQQTKLEQIFLIQSQDFGSEDSCPGITSLAAPVPVEGS